MAIFQVPNQNLLDFAVFNGRLLQEIGLVAFDQEDYQSIVQDGTTRYYFADGDTIENMVKSLIKKVDIDSRAKNILFGVEINHQNTPDFIRVYNAFDTVEDAFSECENVFYNIYPVEEPVCRMHLLVNF